MLKIPKRCSTCNWYEPDVTPEGRRISSSSCPFPCKWEKSKGKLDSNQSLKYPDSWDQEEEECKMMMGKEGTECLQYVRYRKNV